MSERFEPHTGPQPAPLAVDGPLGLTGGLREAWSPMVRSRQVLAYLYGRVGRAD